MNLKNHNQRELEEILIGARKNNTRFWKWYNGLNVDQMHSHYTRHHGTPIKQCYSKEVQQLPSIKQIIEEQKERIKNEA